MEEILTENIYDKKGRRLKRMTLIFMATTLIFLILSIVFIILYISEKNNKKENNDKNDNTDNKDNNENSDNNDNDDDNLEVLTLWNDTDVKNLLINYVKNVTNESSGYFVQKKDRVAVFDFDGTLFQETDPIYLDHKLFLYRVFEDPSYNASNKTIEIANKIKGYAENGTLPPLDVEVAKAMAFVYKDMKIKELYDYVKEYIDKPSDGYNNMKRGDAFYKPMLELIEYLQRNDFIVYVVSGTDTFVCRSIIDGHINISYSQIIGTETRIVADNQGNSTGLDYRYTINDTLQFKGELIAKNLNMNKVYYIIKEIGRIPILSFGNSGSDSSMAELTLQNPKGMAFMLLCDDLERERGDLKKAASFNQSCIENNWVAISMKNDWKTIYGYNVTRKNNTTF